MLNKTPLVSIIIPAWNNWSLTKSCLESLAEHTTDITYQIIIVDNGSTDNTATEAPQLGTTLFADRFTYSRLPENEGFAKACNHGANKSSAKYLFFLNNDTTVTRDWLPPLIKAINSNTRLSGVGPLLLFPEGTIRANRVQHLGIASMPGPDFLHLYEMFPADHPLVHKRRKLSVITAAALLIPRRLFIAHNGFHDGFINGMEDVDLCCRISSQGGHFSIIPDSTIYHYTSCTPGRFEHESANVTLLRKRCKTTEETYSRHLAEDGYEPHYTPWLSLTARLPEMKSRILLTEYNDAPSLELLGTLLHREPLWDAGYVHFIQEQLQNGKPEIATMSAYLRSLLCPSLDSLSEYARLMNKYGNQELAEQSQQILTTIQQVLSDKKALKERAKMLERTAREPLTLDALARWKTKNEI